MKEIAPTWLHRAAAIGVALAFTVVVLGAYTRLMDAGLGCPDWPGCYGFLAVPGSADVAAAQARFPYAPVEAHKAWPEMVHRYFAGSLGLLIFMIAALSLRDRTPGRPVKLLVALVLLVILQAAFGMWTVTLKLWPQVVTTHLLGGFATLVLLWLLWLRTRAAAPLDTALRPHAVLALLVTVVQIMLGGWTSSNYAALACPDFPTCQGQWWPAMDFANGFNVFQRVGPNYLGGLLESGARAAIHVTHRLGAVLVFATVGTLAVRVIDRGARRLGLLLILLLMVQIGLGIANVEFTLPLPVATAHNATGALLLLGVVTVNYRSFLPRTPS
jgi:cytochrome c oxidase assembly protein subunit 15